LPHSFECYLNQNSQTSKLRGRCPKGTLDILEIGLNTSKYIIESYSEAQTYQGKADKIKPEMKKKGLLLE